MTVPRFLASTFEFDELPAQTDMAAVIASIEALLTAQTPAWTNPAPGVLKSPVDSAGRFMTLTLDAPAVQRLRMLVQDQNGIVVCQRSVELIGGGANPTTINVYSGQYHLYVESLTAGSAVGEWLAAMMVDPTDYELEDNPNYVIGGGTRNAGGGADGAGSVWDQWFMVESGVSQVRQRGRAVSTSPGVNAGLRDFAGNPQFFPFDVLGIPGGSTVWMGSAYQAYQTDAGVAGGTIKPVAIDNATPAKFRATVAPASAQGARMMIRVD